MSSENLDESQLLDSQQNRPKNITCFVHYNEGDDQSQIFEVLKKFRTEKGLKFSHHHGYIFFTLSSEYLNDLAQVRPFKISKFRTRSEYRCNKEMSDLLMTQRDSFVRMNFNEETGVLTFLSRTTSRIHGQLVRRIFNDSKQEFDRECYQIIRDDNEENVDNTQRQFELSNSNVDGFTRIVTNRRNKPTYENKPRNKSKYDSNKRVVIETTTNAPLIRGRKANN